MEEDILEKEEMPHLQAVLEVEVDGIPMEDRILEVEADMEMEEMESKMEDTELVVEVPMEVEHMGEVVFVFYSIGYNKIHKGLMKMNYSFTYSFVAPPGSTTLMV